MSEQPSLRDRLLTMYSHRGDGIPTQFVNPDGPDAVDALDRIRADTIEECARIAEGCDLPERDWMPGSLYATIRKEVAARIRRAKDAPRG